MFSPRVGKIPWRRKCQPFLPGEFHGQRTLVGYTVHGVAESWTKLSNRIHTQTLQVHPCCCKWQCFLLFSELNSWSIHLFSHLIVSIPWVLLIMLQWLWEYSYLLEIIILFPWGEYPEVMLLDHMVVLFLISWETSVQFFIVLYQFILSTTVYKCSIFSTSWWAFISSFLFFWLELRLGCFLFPFWCFFCCF